jgi:large subunit ribosomal protein L21
MFAIVKTGGKQYKVAKNNIIKVEKIEGALGKKLNLTKC